LFDTFFYPAEAGQIKTESARRRTVEIETRTLSMLDFSTHYLDKKRDNKALHDLKGLLIDEAEKSTKEKFGKK